MYSLCWHNTTWTCSSMQNKFDIFAEIYYFSSVLFKASVDYVMMNIWYCLMAMRSWVLISLHNLIIMDLCHLAFPAFLKCRFENTEKLQFKHYKYWISVWTYWWQKCILLELKWPTENSCLFLRCQAKMANIHQFQYFYVAFYCFSLSQTKTRQEHLELRETINICTFNSELRVKSAG